MPTQESAVKIRIDDIDLEGELVVPGQMRGVVIFSHGSGSSRFSPRNKFVARHLHEKRLATFLFDLLSAEEDEVYENRFDIRLLSRRLVAATRDMMSRPSLHSVPFGYFGASTGAASALASASVLPDNIKAVVSRGGRPDLASDYLHLVNVPTLLIVGEYDQHVLALNRTALEKLPGEKSLEIVHGATHLFEEPGALDEVARLSANWFEKYLTDKITDRREATEINAKV